MSNYAIVEGKILTSQYTLDILNIIEKSVDSEKDEIKKVLYDEFAKLALQGKITFGFVYTDNAENKLRGRIGKFSGFRTGTQFLKLIPDNKRPKSRSTEPTCLRYYDFGKMNWRSFKKNLFVVATSFWNEKENKWSDDPYKAGFQTDWKNINSRFKRVDRLDTPEEMEKRSKIDAREAAKRQDQIAKTLKRKLKKSFDIIDDKIITKSIN